MSGMVDLVFTLPLAFAVLLASAGLIRAYGTSCSRWWHADCGPCSARLDPGWSSEVRGLRCAVCWETDRHLPGYPCNETTRRVVSLQRGLVARDLRSLRDRPRPGAHRAPEAVLRADLPVDRLATSGAPDHD